MNGRVGIANEMLRISEDTNWNAVTLPVMIHSHDKLNKLQLIFEAISESCSTESSKDAPLTTRKLNRSIFFVVKKDAGQFSLGRPT